MSIPTMAHRVYATRPKHVTLSHRDGELRAIETRMQRIHCQLSPELVMCSALWMELFAAAADHSQRAITFACVVALLHRLHFSRLTILGYVERLLACFMDTHIHLDAFAIHSIKEPCT